MLPDPMHRPSHDNAAPSRANTTGIILCGGAGRRAGGADKPLLPFADKPLVAHVVESFEPLADRILISANRNPFIYGDYAEVIADKTPDFPGPLAGVAACLEQTHTPFAIVCPGDAPHVTPRLWRRLLDALSASAAAVVCAQDGLRRQPLFLALDCRSPHRPLTELENYRVRGGRSVLGWLEWMGAVDVDCSDLSAQLVDVDDLETLEALAAAANAGDRQEKD